MTAAAGNPSEYGTEITSILLDRTEHTPPTTENVLKVALGNPYTLVLLLRRSEHTPRITKNIIAAAIQFVESYKPTLSILLETASKEDGLKEDIVEAAVMSGDISALSLVTSQINFIAEALQ